MTNNQALKEKIITYAHEIGIDKIGFASAYSFDHLRDSLTEQQAQGHSTGFEHKIIEERLHPGRLLPQAKTIISIALAYPTAILDPVPNLREDRRGLFARASWGLDYHEIVHDKLNQLIAFIKKESTTATFKPMVDTGELPDVATAERAGLGFIGKNGLLITEEFGSWVYLGEVITNISFSPDKRIKNGCGDCTRCIDACPPGALLGDGRMNGKRCLSYQTQTKGYMPEEFRRKMSHVIYGCDICQMVCPYNQGIDNHFHPEMEPDPEIVQPSLKSLLTISNRDFREKFGHLAGSWRGKKPIQRNAIIALGNYRDKTAMPQLMQLLENDPRPVIRGTAAWALAKIERYYNQGLIDLIQFQLEKETDNETKQEMLQAVERLSQMRKPRSLNRKKT